MCTGRLFGHEWRKRNSRSVGVISVRSNFAPSDNVGSTTTVASELLNTENFDMTKTPIAYVSATSVNYEEGTPLAQSHGSIFQDHAETAAQVQVNTVNGKNQAKRDIERERESAEE